jgi:hypothetical protein
MASNIFWSSSLRLRLPTLEVLKPLGAALLDDAPPEFFGELSATGALLSTAEDW